MKNRILGGFILITLLLFSVDIGYANWLWQSACDYNTGQPYKGPGSISSAKPQWFNNFCIRHSLEVFNWKTFRDCPTKPDRGWSEIFLPGLTADESACYACTEQTEDHGNLIFNYDGSGSVIGTTWIPKVEYKRTCVDQLLDHHTLLGSALWVPWSFWYTKNASCFPTEKNIPHPALEVWKVDSKSYQWDEIAPVCQRWLGTTGVTNGPYFSNAQLAIAAAGANDGTLHYLYTPSISYDGEWTNQDIEWVWGCKDMDSGCRSNDPIYSGPLWHYQSTYTPNPFLVTDNVNNLGATPADRSCDSRVIKPTKIKRICQYILEKAFIEASELSTINANNLHSLSATDPDDRVYMQNILALVSLPPWGNPSSLAFIQMVRNLEKISYANFWDFHRLYYLIPGTCGYTPEYDASTAHPPLIDKIKPTILFNFWGKELINNEKNISYTTGTFLANSQAFTIRFEDSFESTYAKNPKVIWEHWNGISWLNSFRFTLKRVKNHKNEVDVAMIFDSYVDLMDPITGIPYAPPSDGWLPYNSTGAIQNIVNYVEFSGIISDTSGIEKAWLYEFEYSINDYAGNTNTGVTQFTVFPRWIDTSRTIFQKLNQARDDVLYEMSGATTTVWKNVSFLTEKYYANMKDFYPYKVNIFDVYGNPAYNRGIHSITFNDTSPVQIPMNILSITSPSALVASNKESTLSITGTTDMSGSFMIYAWSYVPGKFLEKFTFDTCTWWDDYIESNCTQLSNIPNTPALAETGTFLHIFTGGLDLYVGNRIDLGTKNDIRMYIGTTIATRQPILSIVTVSNFLESLRADSPGFIVTKTGTYLGAKSAPFYSPDRFATGTFIPEQTLSYNVTDLLKVYSAPLLNLIMDGIGWPQNAIYYLNKDEDSFGSGVIFGSGQLNRIYVEWNKSSTGKEWYVSDSKNIASLNGADMRNQIKKNVWLLTRNRKPGSSASPIGNIASRVKYLQWDITLSTLTDLSEWDTLIIEKWNLIIDADFNIAKTRKGIIVIGESGWKWHIYIKPNVQFIGAKLFAEDSIESIRDDGSIIDYSDSDRALMLSKQIVFFGWIYSKNTIWWGVRGEWGGTYLLPWNVKSTTNTTDLDLAVKYDLAFLRMNNFGSKDPLLYNTFDPSNWLNRGRDEFVIILFDNRNISNPLPWFELIDK